MAKESTEERKARLERLRAEKAEKAAASAEGVIEVNEPDAEAEDEEEVFAETEEAVADAEPDAPAVAEPEVHPLLRGMDPAVAALFTPEEVAGIEAAEQDRARQEKKAAALKSLRAKALLKARAEAGLVPESSLRTAADEKRLAELVTWRCRLPKDGSGHRGKTGIKLDQVLYVEGNQYTTTRAVFETVNEIMNKAWIAEYRFKGIDPQEVMNMPGLNGALN